MAGETSRWCSYDEAANILGVSPETAKRLSLRRGWPRRAGPMGGTQVAVPGPSVSMSQVEDGFDSTWRGQHPFLDHLEAQVDRLTEELAEARTEMRGVRYEAESLRVDAARAQVLAALIEAERARSVEIKVERDRLALELAERCRPWLARLLDASRLR